jgi:hypothetical protein
MVFCDVFRFVTMHVAVFCDVLRVVTMQVGLLRCFEFCDYASWSSAMF